MEWNIENISIATLSICLGSILQAATGLGAGLIIVPLLALISYSLLPGPMIFASLSLTMIMTIRGWNVIVFDNFAVLLSGLLVGIVVAATVLSYLPLPELGVVFGSIILIAVAISAYSTKIIIGRSWYLVVGGLSGFMGTTAAIGAPVLALLYQTSNGPAIRATLAFLYFVSSLAILVSLALVDRFSIQEILWGFYLMPGFILGYFIAPFFANWIDRGYARTTVLLVSAASAVLLIFKSI